MWAEERHHSQPGAAAAVLRLNFSSDPHLMSLHISVSFRVSVPAQYVGTRQTRLASVQGPYARSRRLCEAFIRARAGQSCRFLSLWPYMVQATLFLFFFFRSCPARLKARRQNICRSAPSLSGWWKEGSSVRGRNDV